MRARTWVALATLVALGGCRAIAGYRDLTYGASSDAGCEAVVLPSAGSGRIRLVNAGTRGATTDFCIRPSGATRWGAPIFASSGSSCDVGLAYATATVPFAVGAGTVDVEAVPAGKPCSAPATSIATAIAVGDAMQGAPVITLVRLGGEATSERIVALPEESTSTTASSVRMRFVNAIDGAQAIQVGLTNAPALPATIFQPILPAPLPPGGVEPPTTVTGLGEGVDATGYVYGVDETIPLAVAFQGETSALFVVETPAVTDTRTVFAIGNAQDNLHALRGLTCQDAPPAALDGGLSPSAGPLLANCSLSDLPTLAVDTIDVALYGAFAPFEDDRRPALYAAIAGRGSDLVCVTNVNRQDDKVAIASAAAARFPFAFYPTPPTDLDTQPADATTIDGGAPQLPPGPPCEGVAQSKIDAFYQCAAKNCSSTRDMSGTIATTNCLTQECTVPGSALYRQGPPIDACFDCIIYYMTSEESLAYGESECTTDPRQPFTFDGRTSQMILSHYPLAQTRAVVLPGSGFRKALLYAEVELEDQPVDFYCTDLISPNIDGELPYVGAYGKDVAQSLADGGSLTENGWEDEQDNQVAKVVAFVQANSAKRKRPAIVTGFWDASVRAVDGAGNVLVDDASREVVAALDSSLGGAFVRAEPPGYVPACDSCPAPTNLYNGSAAPAQDVMTFLSDFAPNSVTEDTVWGTGNGVTLHTIPYESAPAGGVGPISEVFPRLVRIVRPRAP